MNRERHQAFEKRQAFLSKLEEVQEWFINQNIPYRILGSVAVSSYAKNVQLNFDRKNVYKKEQIAPDIDILVARGHIRTVKNYTDRLSRNIEFPLKIDLTFPIAHMDFRPNESESYLVHRKLNVPVKTELFNPVIVNPKRND